MFWPFSATERELQSYSIQKHPIQLYASNFVATGHKGYSMGVMVRCTHRFILEGQSS